MTKEDFLTIQWNNILTTALGLPALLYVIAVIASSAWTEQSAFIGLSIIGVLY